MYAYTIQNNVFLIVQGVAKDVAPLQGHVYGSFKGINLIVTYLQPITFILWNYIYKVFVMFFSIDNFHIFSFKNHNNKKIISSIFFSFQW